MKRVVKVYIDVPSQFYDVEVVEEYFRDALLSEGGHHHPTDPRFLLGKTMTIDHIQVGPKRPSKPHEVL